MAIDADTLLDRARLKRQLTTWQVIAIVVAVVLVVVLFEKGWNFFDPQAEEYIARFDIEGIIVDNQAAYDALDDIRDDDDAKALIVYIDSPGGTVTGGMGYYNKLKEIGKDKPVVAVMRTMATSGGYMAAIGAEHIVAQEGTVTGSVGVIFQSFQALDLIDKIGISPMTFRSGELKAVPNSVEPASEEAKALMQDVVDDFFQVFLSMVKHNRHLTDEQVGVIRDGRIFTGKQAYAVNLVDALGAEDEALGWLKSRGIDTELDVVEVEPQREPPSIAELIGGHAYSALDETIKLNRLDGLLAIWHPNLL